MVGGIVDLPLAQGSKKYSCGQRKWTLRAFPLLHLPEMAMALALAMYPLLQMPGQLPGPLLRVRSDRDRQVRKCHHSSVSLTFICCIISSISACELRRTDPL